MFTKFYLVWYQVDQAVAMAFGHNRTSNYVRIQVL